MNKRTIISLIILCNSLLANCQEKITTRLGIPSFLLIANSDDQQKYEWLELGFSESLTDAFSRVPKFNVIERNQVSKLLKEQNFQKSNDTSSIVKAGKILGIDLMLVGSCQVTTGHALVNMRIVNVETGAVTNLSGLPIITPVDSILFLQKKLCLEVLNQFKVNKKDNIVQEIERATSSSTKNFKAYEFLSKGIELFNNKQYKQAIDMYSRALIIDKKYDKAYFKRAQSESAVENYSGAVENYKKIDNYIRKDSVFVLISDAYQMQGLNSESLEYLKMAKKLNPENLLIDKKLSEMQKLPLTSNNKLLQSANDPETIFEYKKGIARIKKNKKYGFIDLNNKLVVPLEYDELHDFSNGLAAAKLGSKWGFIDIKGNFIIEPLFTEVSDFDKYGLAKVIRKIKWGVIDKQGKTIVPIEFENGAYILPNWESSEYIVTCKASGILGLEQTCGVYGRDGKIVLSVIYDDIMDKYRYRSGKDEYPYFHVSFNKKWGVVDRQNHVIVPFSYENEDCIREFKNNFAAVKVNERWGFVNNQGVLIVAPSFEKVNDYNGKLFEVRNKAKWGALSQKGVFTIPCEFENIQYLENEYYAVEKNDKWGIINSNNEPICDFIYEEMGSSITKDYITILTLADKSKLKVEVKLDGKTFYVNENCKCIYNCK